MNANAAKERRYAGSSHKHLGDGDAVSARLRRVFLSCTMLEGVRKLHENLCRGVLAFVVIVSFACQAYQTTKAAITSDYTCKETLRSSQAEVVQTHLYQVTVPSGKRANVKIVRIETEAVISKATDGRGMCMVDFKIRSSNDGGCWTLNKNYECTLGAMQTTHMLYVELETYPTTHQVNYSYYDAYGNFIPDYREVEWTAWSCTFPYTITVTYEDLIPDLTISALTTSPVTEAAVGEAVALSYVIKNNGTMATPATTAEIYDGTDYLGQVNVPSISAGSSYSGTFSLPNLSAGTHPFLMWVDPYETILESNDNNNVASVNLNVYDSVPYTVRFDANGGSGYMADQSFVYGTAQSLRTNVYSNGDKVFKGWATSAGGNVVYSDRQSVKNLSRTSGAVVVLYATWADRLEVVDGVLTTVTLEGWTECLIPTTVRSIGANAFKDCVDLRSVIIPSSVTNISEYAFQNCIGLTTLSIPSSVKSVGRSAFEGCTTLKSVEITDLIAWCACSFYNRTANPLYYAHDLYLNGRLVTELDLPYGAQTFGAYVMVGCTNLTSVSLPDSVERIGGGCLWGCGKIRTMSLPFIGRSRTDSSWWLGSFWGQDSFDGSLRIEQYGLVNGKKTSYNFYIPTILNEVTLTDAETIPNGVFSGCSNLASIVINSGVTHIGSYAFSKCHNLRSFCIPSTVKAIGGSAFSNCDQLVNIQILEGVQELGAWAFASCLQLKNVALPNSVTNIGDSAFCNCEKLESVVIPEGVTRLRGYTFYTCGGLKKVILPSSLQHLGAYEFAYCTNLTSVLVFSPELTYYDTLYKDTPSSLTTYVTSDWRLSKKTWPDRAVKVCDTLQVVFNANGGCNFMSAQNFMKSVAMPLRLNQFSKIGCDFGGWAKTAGGSVAYSDGQEVSLSIDTTLYAVWRPASRTITFSAKGGSVSETSRSVDKDSPVGTLPTPTKDGYLFNGWWTAASGGTQITASTIVTADATYYAHWTAIPTYTITYKPGSYGTGSQQTATKTQNVALTLKGAIFTRTGYTQSGWATSDGGSKVYNLSASYTANANQTFYPAWTPNAYTVTLDRQNGSGGTSSVTATYGSAMPAITVPTRSGYTFGGYYTSSNGGGTQYYNASGTSVRSWNVTSATTLYAKWTAIPTYTITYKPGSYGTGSQQAATKTQNVALTLKGAIFTRTGYTQSGWATSDGGSKVYNLSASYTANANQTFYPFWTPNTYAVTLDRQNGSGGTSSVTATYGSAMPSITVPTRAGYAFGGYYTGANGGGTQYYTASGSSARNWNLTSATTLYAKWEKTEPDFVIDGDGVLWSVTPNGAAEVSIPSGVTSIETNAFQDCSNLVKVTIPSTVKYIKSRAFWGCSRLREIVISDGVASIGEEAFRDCRSLPRIVVPNSVTTIGKGAFSGCASLGEVFLPCCGRSQSSPTRRWRLPGRLGGSQSEEDFLGYVFGTYAYEGSVMIAQRAHTSARPGYMTRTFYMPEGLTNVVITGNAIVSYGAFSGCSTLLSVTLSAGVTDIGSYAFAGSGCLTSVTMPRRFEDELDSTVFEWCSRDLQITYYDVPRLVTFDANGGMVSEPERSVNEGAAIGILPIPTREGYLFDGWWTSANDGTQVMETTIVMGDETYYAHWQAKAFTVTFVATNGKLSGSRTKAVQYNETYGTLPTATQEGYNFLGWFTERSGGTQVTADTKMTTAADHTLYSHWKKAASTSVTVTFNATGGTVSPATRSVASGATVGTLPTPTQTGYDFLGWWTAKSGGTQVTASTKVTTNVTYCAHWQAKTFTVTFVATNGKLSGSRTKTVQYNKTYGTLPTATQEGYNFLGWFTERSGGTQVTAATKMTTAADHTLYSHWKKAAAGSGYTVTFNATGGSVSPATRSVASGATVGTLPTPTQTGYDFLGWWTAKSGGTQVTATTKVTANATYYAHWQAKTFTVTFVATNGKLSGSRTKTVQYNKTYGTLPTATQDGYNFIGWFTERSGGTQVTADTKMTTAADHTLYSHWKRAAAASVTMAFNVSETGPKSGSFAPGELFGTFADGDGTFALMLDEGLTTAYLVTWTEDGGVSCECEAEVLDDALVLTTEEGTVYRLTWNGGNLVAVAAGVLIW